MHPALWDKLDRMLEPGTYQRQCDRRQQDLVLAEAALDEAVTEHMDVEGILGFAEATLTDESRLFEDATREHKRRLQRTLVPEGVVSEPGLPEGLRTVTGCGIGVGRPSEHRYEPVARVAPGQGRAAQKR